MKRQFKSTDGVRKIAAGLLLLAVATCGRAAEGAPSAEPDVPAPAPGAETNGISGRADQSLREAVPPARWQEIERSIDLALAWLASEQQEDGSFPSVPAGQPGVTSLGIMAFLSRGHQPGIGPYGEALNRAIDFVLSCQKTNGLLSYEQPGHQHFVFQPSHTGAYNHAIAGLMLGEAYGQVAGDRGRRMREAIQAALRFTRELQVIRPKRVEEQGGWRYLELSRAPFDSDLSVTGWHLMFLRSARNAEFEVPENWVSEATSFVGRCWNPQTGGFAYGVLPGGQTSKVNRGMTGAGVLCLSLGGMHRTPMAVAAGDWLLARPYRSFGETTGESDLFFYSAYYCSQAAAQLGGRYWEQIYPAIAGVLLGSQHRDGSWPPEVGMSISRFGNHYSTSLAVLSLAVPYQLLPVYQR